METLKLIEIDEKVSLLYHGESMSIIPLNLTTDEELILALKNDKIDSQIETKLKDTLYCVENNNWANRQSDLTPGFSSIVLPLSANCNLKCPYCFAQATNGSFGFNDFTKGDIDNVLLEIEKTPPKQRINLIFFGGEPLIRFDLIEYTTNVVKEKYPNWDVGFSITTNGTLINNKIAKFFKDNNIAVLLSMDGFDNDFNFRRYKNGKSSVSRVLKAITMLKSNNVYFEIRATLTSQNPYMFETYVFFEKLKCPYTIAFAYSSENKSNRNLSTYSNESLQSISKAFERLFSYYKERIYTNQMIYNNLFHETYKSLEMRLHKEVVCAAGSKYITVLSNGDVYSCAHLMNNPEFRIGNIHNVRDIMLDQFDFTPKPISEIKGCMKCWAKYLCNGGCPSQKESLGIKANERFPIQDCELRKIMFEFYIKLYYEYKNYQKNKSPFGC